MAPTPLFSPFLNCGLEWFLHQQPLLRLKLFRVQGVRRFGSRGNMEVWRMLWRPRYSMHTLSRPARRDGSVKYIHIQNIISMQVIWVEWNGKPKNKLVFLTNASTTMWWSSIPEGVDVSLDLLQICNIVKMFFSLATDPSCFLLLWITYCLFIGAISTHYSYRSGDGWPGRSATEHRGPSELQTGSPRPAWTCRTSWSISGKKQKEIFHLYGSRILKGGIRQTDDGGRLWKVKEGMQVVTATVRINVRPHWYRIKWENPVIPFQQKQFRRFLLTLKKVF